MCWITVRNELKYMPQSFASNTIVLVMLIIELCMGLATNYPFLIYAKCTKSEIDCNRNELTLFPIIMSNILLLVNAPARGLTVAMFYSFYSAKFIRLDCFN